MKTYRSGCIDSTQTAIKLFHSLTLQMPCKLCATTTDKKSFKKSNREANKLWAASHLPPILNRIGDQEFTSLTPKMETKVLISYLETLHLLQAWSLQGEATDLWRMGKREAILTFQGIYKTLQTLGSWTMPRELQDSLPLWVAKLQCLGKRLHHLLITLQITCPLLGAIWFSIIPNLTTLNIKSIQWCNHKVSVKTPATQWSANTASPLCTQSRMSLPKK